MATSLRSRTTVKPPAKDAIDVGMISFRTVLTSVDPGWEIIFPEDLFVKKILKAKLQNAINGAVEAILAGEESSQEDDDSNDDYNQNVSIAEPLPRRPDHNPLVEKPIKPTIRRGCIRNMLFQIDTYHLMQERGLLPEAYDSYRLQYELDHNHLIVHMASPVHDAAANSWNDTITLWHTNGGNGASTLRQRGQGRITHFKRYILTFPEYRWMAGSEKSPDQSFVPCSILSPPSLIIPGTIAAPYPTMVIEVCKTHESYNDLFDDAAIKHFSAQTSVQVWIGVKLYDGHGGRFRCMFRLRDPINNGILAGSGASTDFLSIHQPTNIEFVIPKSEIFWGVNPPLPPTRSIVPGPNALPPPQAPGTPNDDLVLSLEVLRDAVVSSL